MNERNNLESVDNLDAVNVESGEAAPADTPPEIKNHQARTNGRETLRRLTGIAIFSALAFVVTLVCKIIPPIEGFLSLDLKDAIIAMASFIYGPISAVIIAFVAAFIELFTISTTGWYGFVMNFVSSAVFSLVASLIYRKLKSINGALIGFFAAVASVTATMLVLNIFVTPLYMAQIGVPLDAAGVIAMIPEVLLPFNFSKALLNSALAMMIYKPLSTALRHIGFATGDKKAMTFNKSTVVILIVGTVSLAIAVAILLVISLT